LSVIPVFDNHFIENGGWSMPITTDSVLQRFKDLSLDFEGKIYLLGQAKRYAYLVNEIEKIRLLNPSKNIRILDIGPSFLTVLLKELFINDTIDTMGLNDGGQLPVSLNVEASRNYYYDLNDAIYTDKWLKVENYDLVIMAEVIEHLFTAPSIVLGFIRSLMAENGYLVVQTPNAVALHKRIRMFMGKNPYELIRENRDNPGHFREYTKSELISIAQDCDFNVISAELENYFDYRIFGASIQTSRGLEEKQNGPFRKTILKLAGKGFNFIMNVSPPSLKPGLTIMLRKPLEVIEMEKTSPI